MIRKTYMALALMAVAITLAVPTAMAAEEDETIKVRGTFTLDNGKSFFFSIQAEGSPAGDNRGYLVTQGILTVSNNKVVERTIRINDDNSGIELNNDGQLVDIRIEADTLSNGITRLIDIQVEIVDQEDPNSLVGTYAIGEGSLYTLQIAQDETVVEQHDVKINADSKFRIVAVDSQS